MFYVITMVITKKISREYSQKEMEREPKHITAKNQQNTKEGSKRRKGLCKKNL